MFKVWWTPLEITYEHNQSHRVEYNALSSHTCVTVIHCHYQSIVVVVVSLYTTNYGVGWGSWLPKTIWPLFLAPPKLTLQIVNISFFTKWQRLFIVITRQQDTVKRKVIFLQTLLWVCFAIDTQFTAVNKILVSEWLTLNTFTERRLIAFTVHGKIQRHCVCTSSHVNHLPSFTMQQSIAISWSINQHTIPKIEELRQIKAL